MERNVGCVYSAWPAGSKIAWVFLFSRSVCPRAQVTSHTLLPRDFGRIDG